MNDGTVACTRPPAGWTCSRGDGHEGPCAATAQSATALPLVTQLTIEGETYIIVKTSDGSEDELVTAQSADGIAAEAMLILVAHQRYDITGCLCGWAELGKSHAAHQAAMLAEAGLLREDKG